MNKSRLLFFVSVNYHQFILASNNVLFLNIATSPWLIYGQWPAQPFCRQSILDSLQVVLFKSFIKLDDLRCHQPDHPPQMSIASLGRSSLSYLSSLIDREQDRALPSQSLFCDFQTVYISTYLDQKIHCSLLPIPFIEVRISISPWIFPWQSSMRISVSSWRCCSSCINKEAFCLRMISFVALDVPTDTCAAFRIRSTDVGVCFP